jgi:Tol biopolymer transport system component
MKKWSAALVLIVLAAMSASAQQSPYNPYVGGKNKVRWDKFKWYTYDTPHFRISYYDRVEPSLEKIASYAESAYDDIARKLNFQILKPVPLICYATHAEFEQTNIIVSFIPEGVGAFATPVRNRMVLPVDLPDRELQALIQHELTHIFQYEIFFGGRRGRAIYARPPLWFMEGMASYFGDDETSRDEMYMRDAALSDQVPSIQRAPQGFLAYRYGHKVFEYIEEEWGEDVVRDFVFSFRGNFGGQIGRPLDKVLNMEPEEFDAAFRTWLRRKYQPYATRGVPGEFGRKFRVPGFLNSSQTSPAISPSGDLVAAFTTYKRDVDVAIFGVPDRRLYKNLTKGLTTKYQYLVAQGLTVAPAEGRDLAFSPDGNYVAVFARTERERSLLLLDVRKGGIKKKYRIELPVDQASQPAYSPDGRYIAFHAVANEQFDIFMLDLETGGVTNFTNDPAYDAAPTFSPDGKSLVYTSTIGGAGKLIGLDLSDPDRREQLTFGPGNDEGAAFSPDGERLYFASDRQDGVYDLYRLDADTRELTRLTYVIGGAINPVAADSLEGERVGFQAYSNGIWELYGADANQGESVGKSEPPTEEIELEPFVPAVSIDINPDKAKKVKGRKFYLEDAGAYVGVDTTNQILGQAYLTFSDQYGDRRIQAIIDSVDTFSNFLVSYYNLEPRIQWGVSIYDSRSYYITGYDPIRFQVTDKQQLYRYTAAEFNAQYPLSTYYRLTARGGYLDRRYDQPVGQDPQTGRITTIARQNKAPYVGFGAAGDTTFWKNYGPHKGARWEARYYYAYDTDDSGALTQNITLDARAYVPTSQRSELAFRAWVGMADGNQPWIFSFGGLDTLRGYPTYSLSGNRTWFANIEWRFPLVDRMDLAFLRIGGIRGRIFMDVGAAWYVDRNGNEFNMFGDPGFTLYEDGVLVDGVSSYGWGLDLNLFGLPMHWDWVKIWNFDQSLTDWETNFWIGVRF